MRIIFKQKRTLFSLLVILFLTANVRGQQNNKSRYKNLKLGSVTVSNSIRSAKKIVERINSSEDFKYRKELRRSKTSKKIYVFTTKNFSEEEIIKQLKIAARKSDSVSEFINYLNKKKISFIDSLDTSTVSILYKKIRSTTFNGYLDDLEETFGSNF